MSLRSCVCGRLFAVRFGVRWRVRVCALAYVLLCHVSVVRCVFVLLTRSCIRLRGQSRPPVCVCVEACTRCVIGCVFGFSRVR